jgi:hypothetical protein
MRSYGGNSVTSSSKKRTVPEVTGKSPVIALKSVVLPAPFAPSTARRSPAATEKVTLSIAFNAPKARVTPLSVNASPEATDMTARWPLRGALDAFAALRTFDSM